MYTCAGTKFDLFNDGGFHLELERTLILLKPDAVQRGLIGEIIRRIEQRGLRIAALKLMQVTPELAARHYGEHAGKSFYESLISFITSSPIVAMVVEGPEAVAVMRATMGKTNAREAAPGTIRGDLGNSKGNNLVHGSDSLESAKREVALFFKPEEICSYRRDFERWVEPDAAW
ncbi:MAG: nucleoside-diphosphate kinase [Anaerolineae bacterium]|nr:nucleoside-diphosphate kinase [Anaerolineae bacterium]